MGLPGFKEGRHAVGDAEYHVAEMGDGPPLLLLHGFPETHFCWHDVAPRLSASTLWLRPICAATVRPGRPPAGRRARASASARWRGSLSRDAEDRDAGRRITVPSLLVTGKEGAQLADAPAVWRAWAHDVTATDVPGGHFLPEEAPIEALAPFLGTARA